MILKILLENIPNKITTHLGIICDVNPEQSDDKLFLEITVPPYDVPISYHGRYYYRVGSTLQKDLNKLVENNLIKSHGSKGRGSYYALN